MGLGSGLSAGLLLSCLLPLQVHSTPGADPPRPAASPPGADPPRPAASPPGAAFPPAADTSQESTAPPAGVGTGPSSGVQYGLIIAGLGGAQQYVDRNLAWAQGLYDLMKSGYGFAEDRLTLLVEDPAAMGGLRAGKSTLEEIQRALAGLARLIRPRDDLFILLIGHGSAAGTGARLNIPGPDLTAATLGEALGEIRGRYTVVVNGASSSAPFIQALSGPGRVIVTATRSGNERLSTIFPEHLIASLKEEAGDLDKNGRISVLESFIYARNRTAEWYEGQGLLATEHPLLDDNGDGRGSREPGPGGTDGTLAGRVYFGRGPVTAATTGSPGERSLRARVEELRVMIDELKARKSQTAPEEYAAEMEELLIELARVSRRLRTLEGNPP